MSTSWLIKDVFQKSLGNNNNNDNNNNNNNNNNITLYKLLQICIICFKEG